MKKIINTLWLLPLMLLICALPVSCIGEDDPEPGTVELIPGDELPEFSVVMNDGETITDESLRGKTSLIVFFNTGCPDCKKELPVIQRVYDECPEVTIVCISRNEEAPSIEKYWNDNGLTLPYSAQSNADVFHLFAKSQIPRIYVVDAELIIRQVFTDNPLATFEELVAETSSNSF
ncbi:TlpA family protein disulfide reductase [Phocaeicola sp.]